MELFLHYPISLLGVYRDSNITLLDLTSDEYRTGLENHSVCRRTCSDATCHTIVTPCTALGLTPVVFGKQSVSIALSCGTALCSANIFDHAADIEASVFSMYLKGTFIRGIEAVFMHSYRQRCFN